ncbi:MAG: HD-GYP domain-containing protein [Dehalococcoidia bacterium]
MLRVSVAEARPGMVLGRAVYDIRGEEVVAEGARLTEDSLVLLARAAVSEILIEDPRVADVPVGCLFSASLEARAVQALHVLLALKQGVTEGVTPSDLREIQMSVHQMVQPLFPMPLGDPDLSGSSSLEGYAYIHPVKVAGLSMLLGRVAGFGQKDLVKLGMAAMLQNIGCLSLPPGILEKEESLTEQEWQLVKKHPQYGVQILANSGLDAEILRAIHEHHERWDGSGYPEGRKGLEISTFARIIGMADVYYSLLCRRPHREALKPQEAVEFIASHSSELFDPELADIFARQIPQYPAGLVVRLSSGEVGIITNANPGHIGRPVVRICLENGKCVGKPYDLDLSQTEYADKTIVEALRAMPEEAAAGTKASATSVVRVLGSGDLTDVIQRIEKLEEALSRLEQCESTARLLQADVDALAKRLEVVGRRLNGIPEHLQSTVGYRLRDVFECEACGSKGMVAARIICTECRGESWWGWWPKKT